MTVVIHQPSYLPWLGFFDRVAQADLYVILDDVQYDKHGWRNRNRIAGPNGVQWLTVPILTKGQGYLLCREARIDPKIPWARKHLQAIRTAYGRAPYFARYFSGLSDLLMRPWERLIDLDVATTHWLFTILGLTPRTLWSSSLGVPGVTGASDRLVKICQQVGATEYISPDQSRGYLETALFDAAGIRWRFHDYRHPIYRQVREPFMPYLSVLDLVMQHGGESLAMLTSARQASGVAP